MSLPHMEPINREELENQLKKGSTELLVLTILEATELHGYLIKKEIERRSNGVLCYHAASLYPLLYRLERRGLIHGKWVEKPGQRRRRYYRLTTAGVRTLALRRDVWKKFADAVNQIVSVDHA